MARDPGADRKKGTNEMADRQEDKRPKTEPPVEDLPPTEEKSADVKGGGLQVGTLAHGTGGGAGKG